MFCPFCLNENKNLEDLILFSTENTMCVLSLTYVKEGHLLIIPKKHVKTLRALDKEEYDDFYNSIQKTMNILNKKFDAQKILLYSKDGPSENKTVEHSHIHLIPIRKDESLPPVYPLDTNSGFERKKLTKEKIIELKKFLK
ncbi:MAG: HIT domain-containing protein [Candidatus Aenigmarchaeota archaeon]|nr:HIT domain-containing protein [Candidatus Aenigmarchaeota archaeon]